MAGELSKEEAVDYLAVTYPQAQVCDIYKSFYQDNYGPGHLLGDTIAAKNYFLSELNDSSEWGGPDFEFTGEGKNFVRLNMDLVRRGLIPCQAYFDAFKESLGRINSPKDDLWISEWEEIDNILINKGYHFINEEKDREMIKHKLETKNFTVHHSDNFNKNYNFHYRIIAIPQFEKLKALYLNAQK